MFGSNFGCGFACAAAFALALSSAFFFASSFFKVSAIGSIFGVSLVGSFFSGFGLGLLRLGGAGGGGGASALAASSTFLSVTLALESSTGLGSPIFSTSGAGGLSLGAFLTPLVISENCLSEMMSIGSASVGLASSGLAANEISPHSSRAAWNTAEIVRPVFISGSFTDFAPPP